MGIRKNTVKIKTALISLSDKSNLKPLLSLLKKYTSDNGKIISSKITSVSFGKQKKLAKEIKKAKIF